MTGALEGWDVLVPRGGEWGARVARLLEGHGAAATVVPLIAFAPPDDVGPLDAAVRRLREGAYAWLVVTSATTVDAVANRPGPAPPAEGTPVSPASAPSPPAEGTLTTPGTEASAPTPPALARVEPSGAAHPASGAEWRQTAPLEAAGRQMAPLEHQTAPLEAAGHQRAPLEHQTPPLEPAGHQTAPLGHHTTPLEPAGHQMAPLEHQTPPLDGPDGAGLADAVRSTRVAAVGPGTAAALARAGVTADLVPSGERSARGLLADFPRAPADGPRRVLLPHSDLAEPTMADGLAALGWEVDDVVAYRTVPGEFDAGPVRERLADGGFDAVLLSSASTVRNLVALLGAPPSSTRVAVIGPRTREAAEKAGLTVHVQPDDASGEALVAALVADAARLASGPRPARGGRSVTGSDPDLPHPPDDDARRDRGRSVTPSGTNLPHPATELRERGRSVTPSDTDLPHPPDDDAPPAPTTTEEHP